MKAAYVIKPTLLEIRELEPPVLRSGEVLVKIHSVGVCGSDVHYWQHGRIGKYVIKEPMILGHEVAGEIVETAPDVEHLQSGDRVVLEPGIPCGHCSYCKTGHYNLCLDIRFFATPPIDGACCEYVAHPASFTYKIPDDLPYDLATTVEPLSVGLFASRRVQLRLSEKVIIYGSGMIGLCCLLIAKDAGARSVTVVDIREDRLKVAADLGADETINLTQTATEEGAYDLAFECSGVEASLIDAARAIRPGGRIAGIGLGADSIQKAPIVSMVINEQAFLPSFRYANTFPAAIGILGRHKQEVQKLITHHYPLADAEAAFEAARDDQTAIKIIIDIV